MKNLTKFIQEKYLIDNNTYCDYYCETVEAIERKYNLECDRRPADYNYIFKMPENVLNKVKPIFINTTEEKLNKANKKLNDFLKDNSDYIRTSNKYYAYICSWDLEGISKNGYIALVDSKIETYQAEIDFDFENSKIGFIFRGKNENEIKEITKIMCLVFEFVANYEGSK